MKLTFVRPCVTNWHYSMGIVDLGLNTTGQQQASQIKINKNIPVVVFSSPALRARETASYLGQTTVIEQLATRYFGNPYTGCLDKEENFEERVINIFDIIMKFNYDNIVVVSHQKVFECITYWLIGEKKQLNHGQAAIIELVNNKFDVKIID